MTPLEEVASPFYENRGLFSDHFLLKRLPDLPEWREVEVETSFEQAREIYEKNRDILDNLNEAETEEEFIRPILDEVLGWSYGVQKAQRYQGRLRRPDYGLFLSKETKKDAQAQRDARDYWARAAGVADAKYWARPLDGEGDPDREGFPELSSTNPSMQIVSYLIATGCDWGFLTNGKHWRLYSTRARSRIDTYYEVDLERILLEGDEDAFRRFYVLFRAEAFRVEAETGKTFLERLHEGSVQYGTVLERQLKTLIFDEIFLHLAEGFRAREFGTDTEISQEHLDTIYQGTLRLLYRLLFLLHAEARSLLPVHDERGYGEYSLARLTRRLAERRDEGGRLSEVSTSLWDKLENLFAIIDQGDAALNVPRYNGGLFDEENPANAFLDASRMADRYLGPGLDKLVRVEDPETGQKRFVDYKTLNVEQLGSIYEGLLEFRLRQAEEDLAVLRDGPDVEYKPAAEVGVPSEVVEAGQLYLESDEGERKTTGSYYTPHEVVTYIVEQTLTPVLEERAERFRALMEDLEKGNGDERELKTEAIETILGIRVCDPAMGSGHFLVGATDWLTEHLIPLLNEFPDNPVLERLSEIRERILEEMDEQEIEVDQDRLKDVNLLKRAIMKRCIYGVDLNPMAVELAKLSLWLDSFTVGAPLSFLDHHLTVGNSVAGVSIETVQTQLTGDDQGELFGQQFAGLLEATELMKEVASYTDATLAEVEESVAKYEEFREATEPYRLLLDLWASQHFGLENVTETVRDHGATLLRTLQDGGKLNPDLSEKLQATEALWEQHHFLHWELAFPEVFVDLDEQTWLENPGFDVVIGNPPYLNAWRMTEKAPELRDGLKSVFADTGLLGGHWDLFVPFIIRALQVSRTGGRHSYIVPTPLLREKYGRKLRCERLLVEDLIESILDFREIRVFPGISRQTAVYVLEVGGAEDSPTAGKTSIRELDTIEESVRELSELPYFEWNEIQLLDPSYWRNTYHCQIRTDRGFFSALPILDHVQSRSERLGRFRYVNVGATVSSKEPGKFVKDDVVGPEPQGNAKKYFDGNDMTRYHIDCPGLWLNYRSEEMSGPRVPEQFEGDKVVLRRITTQDERLLAAFDGDNLYCDDNVVVICPYERLKESGAKVEFEGYERSGIELKDHYLLAVLNSRLMSFYFRFRFATSTLQSTYSHVMPQAVRAFPIRSIERFGNTVERERWVEQVLVKCDVALETGEFSPVLAEVEACHEGTAATAAYLHDLLAGLAHRLEAMLNERSKLYEALNPSKWLNTEADVAPFSEVFSDEIKYGELLTDDEDLSVVHHDIGALRLSPDEDRWLLEVELEKRDPETGWREMLKEDDGHEIAREWVPVLRFDMCEKRARYYEQALQERNEFEETGSFPGGFTRTTLEKLRQTTVPEFEPAADLEPLAELRSEIEALEIRVGRLDRLIDEIVYRLYDLSEEDRAFVERVME